MRRMPVMLSRPFAFRLFIQLVIFSGSCLASTSGRGTLLGPNQTPSCGRIIDSERLILLVECKECPVFDLGISKTWMGNDAALLYDIRIVDPSVGDLAWTQTDPTDPDRRIQFYPPANPDSLSPFVRGVSLVAPPSITVSEYLEGTIEPAQVLRVPGTVTALGITNRHRWDITRISYVNGLAYTGPGQVISDVPVVHIYTFQNGSGPVELVWWEIQDVYYYRSDISEPQMPIGLERKLRGLGNFDLGEEEDAHNGVLFQGLRSRQWTTLASITLGVAAICVFIARLMVSCLFRDTDNGHKMLEEDCYDGEFCRRNNTPRFQ